MNLEGPPAKVHALGEMVFVDSNVGKYVCDMGDTGGIHRLQDDLPAVVMGSSRFPMVVIGLHQKPPEAPLSEPHARPLTQVVQRVSRSMTQWCVAASEPVVRCSKGNSGALQRVTHWGVAASDTVGRCSE